MVLTVSRSSARVTPRWSRRVLRPGKRNISLTNSLTGSAALVTPGTSGIGRAIALALAQRGAHVVLSGVTQGAAKRWWRRSARRAGPLASSRPNSGAGTSTSWSTTQGYSPFGPAHEATEEDFDTVFNLNVKAPFFLVADPVPKMAKRRHGVIVNVSTMVAEFGIPRIAPYVSSKAALVLLTKAWRPSTGPPGSGQRRQPWPRPDGPIRNGPFRCPVA
jgi:NAD(P)-dependent dehydrogenase (short-subunit alcohol dehydrogenase family)